MKQLSEIETDRLFSFVFVRVLRDPVQYDYLIRGSKKLGVDKHSQLDWLPLQAWYAIQKLIELSGFEKLAADMLASPNRFKEW